MTWLGTDADIAALSPSWDALAAADPMPFSRSDWFLSWWHAFGDGARLRTCTVDVDGALAGVLPVFRRPAGGLAAVSNAHTPVFRPLARDRAALELLFSTVLDSAPTWLRLTPVPAADPSIDALQAAAARSGGSVHADVCQLSPAVELDGTWSAYRQARRSQLREYERRRRKMSREHRTELVLVTRPDDLAHHLEQGLTLEASGWKGRNGTAILSAPETARFYRELARRFDALGQLRLSSLWVDGRMVAFDLALLDRGRYCLLKTAYDETFRSLAPGMVLRHAVIERCFELGLEAHEFLGRDMPWKRVFANADREHVTLRYFAPTSVGRAGHSYWRGVRPVLRDVRRWGRARAERVKPLMARQIGGR